MKLREALKEDKIQGAFDVAERAEYSLIYRVAQSGKNKDIEQTFDSPRAAQRFADHLTQTKTGTPIYIKRTTIVKEFKNEIR